MIDARIEQNKEHGYIFQAESVLAILDGRKTMTRRVVTPHNSLIDGSGTGIRKHWQHLQWDRAWVDPGPSPAGNPGPYWRVPCRCLGDAPDLEVVHRIYPRVQVGDRIYAKETWRAAMEDYRTYVEFRAGGADLQVDRDDCAKLKKFSLRFSGARKDRHSDAWRSPLYMPRWAARIVVPVIRVGAERLQEITGRDIWAEGLECRDGWKPPDLETWFADLWDGINGQKPGCAWADNPPVWPYEWEAVQ